MSDPETGPAEGRPPEPKTENGDRHAFTDGPALAASVASLNDRLEALFENTLGVSSAAEGDECVEGELDAIQLQRRTLRGLLRSLGYFLEDVLPKRFEARASLYRIEAGLCDLERGITADIFQTQARKGPDPRVVRDYRALVAGALQALYDSGSFPTLKDAARHIEFHHGWVVDLIRKRRSDAKSVKTMLTWRRDLTRKEGDRHRAPDAACTLYQKLLEVAGEYSGPEKVRWADSYLSQIGKSHPFVLLSLLS